MAVTCEKYFADPDNRFADLLLSPVGRVMMHSEREVEAALKSLKKLSFGGFRHGDSRWPNAASVRNDVFVA